MLKSRNPKKTKSFPLSKRYDTWIRESNNDHWDSYIQELRENDELLELGNVFVDVPAVLQRNFECVAHECTPGWRQGFRRSCCADLDVDLTPEEVSDLSGVFDQVKGFMEEHDPLWKRFDMRFESTMGRTRAFTTTIERPRGRCMYSYMDPVHGLRCGIHSAALEHGLDLDKVKPRVCNMFPLVVMDLVEGRFLVTIRADRRNEDLMDFEDHNRYPCLDNRKTWRPLFVSMRDNLVALFGEDFYRALETEAEKRAGQPRRRHKNTFAP